MTAKHSTREVGDFQPVEIDNNHLAKTEQNKIFQNLIAKGTGTNQKNTSSRNLFLSSPGNEAKAAEPGLLDMLWLDSESDGHIIPR